MKPRPKYKNEKVKYDGISFDSTAERDYFVHLLKLREKGMVEFIELQPRIILIPAFERDGRKYRATTYTPDFRVVFTNKEELYIDVKGFSSQQGELRRKLFAYQNEIPLHWIAQSKKYSETGWINYDELQRLRHEAKKMKEKAVG